MTFSQPHERRLGGYLLHVLPTHGRNDRNRSCHDWWRDTRWRTCTVMVGRLLDWAFPLLTLCSHRPPVRSLSPQQHVTNTLSTGCDRWRRRHDMWRWHVLGRPASSHRVNFRDPRRGVVWHPLPRSIKTNKVPALEDTKGSVRHR